jgi:hypothetical protein
VIVGWSQGRWLWAVLTPVTIYISHIIVGLIIDRRFPLRITHARPLNPIPHLLFLPYVLIALAVWGLFHRAA